VIQPSIRNIVAAVVFALVGLTVVFGSWYTIDQTQRGVLLRNGALVEVILPGLHFKWPLIDAVIKVDMQTHNKIYGRDDKTGKSTMEAYSADQQPANLRISVTLRVAADKAAEMYSRFGGDYEAAVSRLVQPHVYERAKTTFGQYTAQRAITNRGQLNGDVAKSLTEAIAYDPIFIIESVQIEDITFSPEYIKSVEARMMAEVEVQRYRQQLEREKVQAEIVITKAKGEADAVVAKAEADAKARVLMGDAEATAIQARGDALSKNPSLVGLVQAERWDGKLPVTMIPGAAVPMIALK
jgi:regulator of protease activity HflC (stomatin/prohibitin superfamily)